VKDIAERTSPSRKVILMLHDWGCVFGYQFAMRHQRNRPPSLARKQIASRLCFPNKQVTGGLKKLICA